MIFDPARKRQSLDEILIPMARSAEFAEAFQLKCLDSYGGSILGTCIECCLVGRFSAGKELLPKARTFLRSHRAQGDSAGLRPRRHRVTPIECLRIVSMAHHRS